MSDNDNTSNENETNQNLENEYEMLDMNVFCQPQSNVNDMAQGPLPQTDHLPGEYELTQCPAYVPVTHDKQTEATVSQNMNAIEDHDQDNCIYYEILS